MGTIASLRTAAAPPADAVGAAWAVLEDADRVFSPFRADSDVCRLDRGEALVADLRPEVSEVLDVCHAVRLRSGGAFDVRATGRLDPSGHVKGWAVQRAADALLAHGVADFVLGCGGDLVTRGAPSPGGRWRVGLQHPLDRSSLMGVVEAGDLAVATSGPQERGDHVLDARSGAAADGVLSVTVTGQDLGLADAYATAAWALGADGPAWTLGLDGYEARSVLADGTVLSTPGFRA